MQKFRPIKYIANILLKLIPNETDYMHFFNGY